jgi:two-component sensor histidine kinase
MQIRDAYLVSQEENRFFAKCFHFCKNKKELSIVSVAVLFLFSLTALFDFFTLTHGLIFFGIAYFLSFLLKNKRLEKEIDRRKQAELELEKTHMQLEMRVKERTIELEKAKRELGEELKWRKQSEGELKQSLEQKERLLKEIHHRVKNSMQIISSMLTLQSLFTGDKKVLQILENFNNRIKSMALVHDMLYQTKDLNSIDSREYLETLLQTLLDYCNHDQKKIALKMDIERVSLDIETAIPLGLIVNELVTNSLKHGFQDTEEGEINISFHNGNGNRITVRICDNGKGLKEDFDIKTSGNMGLHITAMLAHQLNGEVKILKDSGTGFQINVEKTNYTKRI